MEGKGCCGIQVQLNIREKLALQDALHACRVADELKELKIKATESYFQAISGNGDYLFSDQEKEDLKTKEDEALDNYRKAEKEAYKALRFLHGFVQELLKGYWDEDEDFMLPWNESALKFTE